jgi:hypothetical protein
MRETESFFKDRIISKNLWPPRSPDLTPADFFLWRLLKGKVYKNTPRTIQQPKDAICQEIQAINGDTLGKLFCHQLDAQTSCLFKYNTLIKIPNMFRAYPASSW